MEASLNRALHHHLGRGGLHHPDHPAVVLCYSAHQYDISASGRRRGIFTEPEPDAAPIGLSQGRIPASGQGESDLRR